MPPGGSFDPGSAAWQSTWATGEPGQHRVRAAVGCLQGDQTRSSAPARVRADVQAALTVIGRRDIGRDIRRVNLADANLTRADLAGAKLAFADLDGVTRFSGAPCRLEAWQRRPARAGSAGSACLIGLHGYARSPPQLADLVRRRPEGGLQR